MVLSQTPILDQRTHCSILHRSGKGKNSGPCQCDSRGPKMRRGNRCWLNHTIWVFLREVVVICLIFQERQFERKDESKQRETSEMKQEMCKRFSFRTEDLTIGLNNNGDRTIPTILCYNCEFDKFSRIPLKTGRNRPTWIEKLTHSDCGVPLPLKASEGPSILSPLRNTIKDKWQSTSWKGRTKFRTRFDFTTLYS